MNGSLLMSVGRLSGLAGAAALLCLIQALQAFAQPPKAQAFIINERIRLDGRLDEAAWNSAMPIGDLVQVLPKEAESPSERTEVRVLVDSDALYFGITCFDGAPQSIVSTQLTRDANL
ncbi:MAG: putative rane associated hydrolase, partial [Acidobacteria bacterium]|nr:putative rane associated hydrolase [Acidobacteriota bacterium]